MDIEYKQQKEIIKNIREYFYSQFKHYELRWCGVYGFRNKITNQIYIGSTGVTFKQRLGQHIHDLVTLRHSNGYLLNSWVNHNYHDFEFVILEKAGDTDSRKDLFEKEEKFIRMYSDNNIKLFNIDLNENKLALKLEYMDKNSKIKTYKITDAVAKKFKELFTETFYDSMIDSLIVEELLNQDTINIEDLVICLDSVTENEYNGMKYFVEESITSDMDGTMWKHDGFDISECNVIKCLFYNSHNHYCRRYDVDLSEYWTAPLCDIQKAIRDERFYEEEFYNRKF